MTGTTKIKDISFDNEKLLILILFVAASTAAFGAARFVKAKDSNVSFTGRVLNNADGSVCFDWTGVYMQTEFSGGTIGVNIAESDTAYYNLFIDGRWKKKIKIFGKKPMMCCLPMDYEEESIL